MKTGRIVVHYFLSFTLRLAVALGYAAGFNAMVFLPLHAARAQNAALQSASGGSEAAGITADELTSPATASDAGAVLAQAQRLAQSSNKAPGQTQTAAVKTGAATPDFAPPGGVAGLGQVDPSTGKLTFSGPIASVGGNVFVFGDGKMVLSASAKSGGDAWSVENYLFTTATTTITFDVDGASYSQVGTGGAPLLSIIYMNGLTQPIQRHLLNLTRAEDAPGATGKLADVAAAKLFDGWGNIAVQTLQMFYAANSVASDIEMLAYRTSFLPIFDWANGRIDTTARSDLYDFYASGAGLGHVQYPQDPAYAFKYDTRYQEPAGRGDESAGPSYPLGMAASQSRIVTADYQNWNDAGLAAAVGLSGNLENDFRTSDSNNGFGPNLTVYQQKITDPLGLTQIARVAWENSSAAAADKKDQAPASLMHAQTFAAQTPVPADLSPPPGVTGDVQLLTRKLLPNYFGGDAVAASGGFSETRRTWTFSASGVLPTIRTGKAPTIFFSTTISTRDSSARTPI